MRQWIRNGLSIIAISTALLLAGCGGGAGTGGSNGGSTTPPPPTQTGPASGSEFLYSFGDQNQVYASSLNSATGQLTATIVATPIPPDGPPITMYVQFPAVATPNGKYLYALGYDQYHFSNALWSMSITGAKGELTAHNGYYPEDFSTANLTSSGFFIDGKGKFLYLGYPGLNGLWFLQSFVIDSSTGDAKLGPTLTKTYADVGTFSPFATDPAGKYLYAYGASSHGPEIFVYSIDSTTGTLTEITGSPFAIDPNIGITTVDHFIMSPSGKFLYAYGKAPDQSNLLWPAIYVYSIDPSTGIPAQAANSPIIMRSSSGVPKLSSTGNLLFMPEAFTDNQGNVSRDIGVFKVNQTDGSISTSAVSSVSTLLQTFYPDPSGKVLLIGPGGTNYLTMWSYLVDDSTGAITAAQGSPFFATDTYVLQQQYRLVRIP